MSGNNLKIDMGSVLLSKNDHYNPTSQCDCACASYSRLSSIVGSKNLKVESIVRGLYKAVNNVIIGCVDSNYSSAFGVNNDLVLLDQFALQVFNDFNELYDNPGFVNDNFQIIADLFKSGLIVFRDNDPRERLHSDRTLSAWLHITDVCNLRCDYCYLIHESIEMSFDIAKASVEASIRSAVSDGFKRIKFKIAGGEPLLRFDFILELHEYIVTAMSGVNLDFDFVILSNGTLLDSYKAGIIASKKINMMISLDGIDSFHDNQRKRVDGKGSFGQVLTAINFINHYNIDTDISITVTSKNASGLAELTDFLLKNNLKFSFNFYRENKLSINKIGLSLESNNIISGLMDAYKVIEKNLPDRSLLTSLADKADLSSPRDYVCAAAKDYLVFDTNGGIAQCQMQIKKTVSDVKTINPLIDVRNNKSLINLAVSEKNDCSECDWRSWCNGGCPVETKLITDRYDVKSPNCKIYKAIFPEIIRLESKRLIRDHS